MAWRIDVDVVVALLQARHVHSARAVRWLGERIEPGSLIICRVAQMGALRGQRAGTDAYFAALALAGGWILTVVADR